MNRRDVPRTGKSSLALGVFSGLVCLGVAGAVIWTALTNLDQDRSQVFSLLVKPGSRPAEGQALARRVLLRAPFSPTVLSSLALTAEKQGQPGRALAEMTQAGSLSRRDVVADIWLFNNALHNARYNDALDLADALIRLRPDLANTIYPVMIQLSADPAGSKAVAKQLATEPPWRGGLLYSLTRSKPSTSAFAVLSALQATRAPPRPEEVEGYVQQLMLAKSYDQALLAAFLFLPPARLSLFRNLFNGDFNDVGGIHPFDWTFETGDGGIMSIEAPPERPKNKALHVYYDNSQAAGMVAQTLILTPGTYRFSGETQAAILDTADRMQWTLRCLDGGADLGHTTIRGTTSWGRFTTDFTVPADCPAQVLELRFLGADRTAAVDVWYDSLTLNRMDSQ